MEIKKALIVTRVSGFVPQFEMNNVKILQEMGYEVHYAANFNTVVYGTDNKRLDGTGIVCHHIPFSRSPFSSNVLKCCKKLIKIMLQEKLDLIHCHMPMTGIIARIAAEKVRKKTGRNIPVIYTVHGFHFYKGAPLRNWVYYIPEKWCARYTDCLITINEEDYRRACSFRIRGCAEKISGVGIKTDKEILSEKDRVAVREKLGVSADECLLISIGELNANKNHICVLRTLSQMQEKKIKYIICGQGCLEEELKSYICQNNLENQVKLLGYRSDIEKLLQASDIFIFPSLREGLSVSVLEAMAAELPVIAKRIRGNTDLIQDGRGGYLVEEDNTNLYENAIRKLFSDEKLRKEMSKWNRERVKEFSIDKVGMQMREIYERMLN